MSRIAKWFNMKTGFRFWYEIELGYFLKIETNGREIGVSPFRTSIRKVGLANKRTILNQREVKKVFNSWISSMPRKYLRNGIFQIKVITYLGWFKAKRKELQNEQRKND